MMGPSGNKAALYLGVALGTLAWSVPAAAQDAAPAAAAPAEQVGEPDPGDIVVTARRVEERLQDVPISITVFNQAQLTDRNVVSGADLAAYTPSLSVNPRYGSDNATFAIRGFTADARTTASVGVYFADVVSPRGGSASIAVGDGAGPGSFFDLQNVQVLKGPQGTLFGRNTTGGAVLLVPQKPTSNFEGYVEGSYGNYDMKRLQGVLNLPLGPNARLRLGGDAMKRDGFLRNLEPVGPRRFGDSDYVALRASLVVDLAPNLENYTIATFSRSDTNGSVPKLIGCTPGNFPFGTLSCANIARRGDAGYYSVQNSTQGSNSFLRNWQIINTTTWAASDNLTVKNIVSYAELTSKLTADFFGASYVLPATLTNAAGTIRIPTGALAGTRTAFNTVTSGRSGTFGDQSSFTEELQLQGRGLGGRLTWQAGGYIELSDPNGDNTAFSAIYLNCTDREVLRCIDPIGTLLGRIAGGLTIQRFRSSYHDYGLYSQGTFKFTDQLSATAGIRYTWDETRSYVSNVSYRFFPNPNAPRGTCANVLIRSPTLPITSPADCNSATRKDTDAPTWVLGLDFKPTEDVLLYGKYSRGYRQGSTNPLAAAGFNEFDAEKVDTYEVGTKLNWRGGMPGFFNVSGFYNDFRDQQLSQGFIDTRNVAPPNQGIVNVGKSRIYGAEVEAGIRPFAGLNLSGSYAYINSKLLEATTPVFPPGSVYDSFLPLVVGRALPLTPKHKLSVSANYRLPLAASVGAVTLGATYSYNDEMIVSYTPAGTLPSFDLVNLNLNWNGIAGSPVDLALFATNVTGEKYITLVNDQTSGGFVSALLGEPRMYGMRLRVHFGG